MPFDSDEARELARRQRDEGALHPGDPDYDTKMAEMWGGPPIKFYTEALGTWLAAYGADAKGKNVLITGGTGGIGFYIAKALAHIGYTVIMPGRPNMSHETEGAAAAIKAAIPEASLVVPEETLDLGSLTSVRKFAASMLAKEMPVHHLLLNAGRGGGVDDAREETGDGNEAIMQVNIISHYLLAHELFPLLRKAGPGARIVFQSSGARSFGKPEKVDDLNGTNAEVFSAWDQYCLSKAACCFCVRALNDRLAAAGMQEIAAIVSEPGFAATGVNVQHDLTKSLQHLTGEMTTNALHDKNGHHAADGALSMILATVDPEGSPNSVYGTHGKKSASLAEAAYKRGPESPPWDHLPEECPMNEGNWPAPACQESFWAQMIAITGADWSTHGLASKVE